MNQTPNATLNDSEIITLGDSVNWRQTINDIFARRHGELTHEVSIVYRAADGTRLAITYANKNRKHQHWWLNLRTSIVDNATDEEAIFAFALYDPDERIGHVFEVPVGPIAQRILERQQKPFGTKYTLRAVRSGGRFVISEIEFDIHDYRVEQRPLQWLSKQAQSPEPNAVDSGVTYTLEDLIAETYLAPDTLEEFDALLEDKQQIILYGPPGTGKTYVAQKFAHFFVGGDESHVHLIQFHPSYSYEEFMEGIRPEARDDGPPRYPVRPGVFRAFCEQARGEEGRFVLIIDEINRGNIAKIFGELMFLLEYRDRQVPLPYSGQSFSIPDNVYLIGTMNTADRSIALVDFALRRRFHFVHFGADRDLLARWIQANGAPVPYLLDLFDEVNRAIEDRDYQIGFSYFMKPGMTEGDLRRVWRYSIEPYLEEYFFDNRAKVEELTWDELVSRWQDQP